MHWQPEDQITQMSYVLMNQNLVLVQDSPRHLILLKCFIHVFIYLFHADNLLFSCHILHWMLVSFLYITLMIFYFVLHPIFGLFKILHVLILIKEKLVHLLVLHFMGTWISCLLSKLVLTPQCLLFRYRQRCRTTLSTMKGLRVKPSHYPCWLGIKCFNVHVILF